MAPSAAPRRLLVTGGSGFIGSNLVAAALAAGDEVLNLDPFPPLDVAHLPNWLAVDVLDRHSLGAEVAAFAPTAVVHLAANVSVAPSMTMVDYRVNTTGTANILEVVAATPGIERLVVTSTQFVCRPGHLPTSDTDVDPHTLYGMTKVATENLVRRHGAGDTPWVIIRPTTIWGPWDSYYRRSFYALLKRGLYVHPDVPPCWRSYGYVGNVVWQIQRILDAGPEVDGRTLYVGDRPIDLRDYADEFVRQVKGGDTRTVPIGLATALARTGDVLGKVGLPWPLTSTRLGSMTEGYPVPIEPTFELLGEPPWSLRDGVATTVEWLRGHYWAR